MSQINSNGGKVRSLSKRENSRPSRRHIKTTLQRPLLSRAFVGLLEAEVKSKHSKENDHSDQIEYHEMSIKVSRLSSSGSNHMYESLRLSGLMYNS
jgi:hypothetical protein